MTRQRMRRGEDLLPADAVVLRGDVLDEETLRRSAITNFEMFGFYGLSVWILNVEKSQEALLMTKLQKSRVVLRLSASDIIAEGLELWDTGLSPHYDVVYIGADRPDALVEAVMAVPCTTMINPHYDPDGGSDR